MVQQIFDGLGIGISHQNPMDCDICAHCMERDKISCFVVDYIYRACVLLSITAHRCLLHIQLEWQAFRWSTLKLKEFTQKIVNILLVFLFFFIVLAYTWQAKARKKTNLLVFFCY